MVSTTRSRALFRIGGVIRRGASRALARGARLLHERTILALTLMFCAAGTLWHLSRLSSNLVERAALEATSAYADSLEEVRTFYTSDVVERLRGRGVVVTHNYAAREGAIPLPVTFSMELGRRIGERGSGMRSGCTATTRFAGARTADRETLSRPRRSAC